MKNIAYGIYSSLAVIKQRPFQIKQVYLQESRNDKRIQELQEELIAKEIVYEYVAKQELENICQQDNTQANHQGVVVVLNEQEKMHEVDLLEYCAHAEQPVLLLVLDQIVDPHNLGACLRTAEAAGVNAVISSTKNSAPMNSTVRKVACGAAERLPLIFVKNLARYLKELKQLGVWVYGTQPGANKLIYQADFKRSSALVIGAEGSGMRRLIAETCDELVCLPMAGEMASINASVATGIGLFEVVRQRHQMLEAP